MATSDADLTRCCVLSLLCEAPRHGWAVAAELAPGSDLGRVWSVSRQLVYRAIATLEDDGLIIKGPPQPGEGRDKTMLSPTARGRSTDGEWLDSPVEHLRDVRTVFLCKLLLRRRRGLATVRFVRRQRRHLDPVLRALGDSAGDDPVDLWRRESAAATMRFLDSLA